MTRLAIDEIRFHPHSFADPAGRLFRWQGGLYRALSREWSANFRRLHRGILDRLIAKGLVIESSLTDLSLDGYGSVVRHKVVPFATYPEEWLPEMLRDAGLLLLDLLIELAPHGLTLKDAHPWNILFDFGRPVFVDLTSICELTQGGWRSRNEFLRFYLHPLLLTACGHERIARRLLLEYDGILKDEVEALAGGVGGWRRFRDIFSSIFAATDVAPIAQFRRARRQLEKIVLPAPNEIRAANEFVPADSGLDEIEPLLRRLASRSLLQLGAGSKLGRESAERGIAALLIESDSRRLVSAYRLARERRLPLLPVVMDFTDPTPARGLASHWSMAASERLACETVLVPASFVEFAQRRNLNPEQLAQGFDSFSTRWLLLQLPPERVAACGWERALRRRYRSLSRLPLKSSGELFVCEK